MHTPASGTAAAATGEWNTPVLSVQVPVKHLAPGYRVAKRLLDVVVASVALVLFAPLMLLIAIAIKLDSPGPVLFKQTRIGKGGKPFCFIKFRSMVRNAEQMKRDLLPRNEVRGGPVFKMRNDPRVTRVGRFLRRYSLDELPQLLHVLRGEMSLVGPRPPLPSEVASYGEWEMRRLSVTPGLTCLWQISGRSDIGFREWVELDHIYIDTMSFWTDLKILIFTVPAVLSGRGAC
ncbi:MAG: exopolysaccharide biosynthesis polyprenyl glycosylphosphotransferase [Armatimonadota bacterium]|nr:exopolysaccharide biosynthesis polyprenyl glycosylphosphotransferase [bacterium]MCS7309010.1 exopolysaccharide biosynthesis polyprenyl glycosylphosphotransferase [Armatimonadota bacterium]MDW8103435.1 exopolysaccharide biosynthesis polyprenyl glycosylphosphotransferase [Armatimonadota bacterium]MDW8289585.1 exopolysaccharide biosynthesis polyprenyl glycosylphosphotransferase [Armatimonadota bacterium]